METLIVLGGLAFVLAVLIKAWELRRKRNEESTRRMQQDMHTFHADLHKTPTRGRPSRYRGSRRGWP